MRYTDIIKLLKLNDCFLYQVEFPLKIVINYIEIYGLFYNDDSLVTKILVHDGNSFVTVYDELTGTVVYTPSVMSFYIEEVNIIITAMYLCL